MIKDFDFDEVFEADDYLYFYQEILTKEVTKKEISFLTNELNIKKGMRILDLACGYGRHSNILSEIGCNVVGIDNNNDFINIANSNNKFGVNYIKDDMRNIKYENEFDIVLLLFSAFGYFDDSDNLKVLDNISKSMKKGGLFCFDTFNRDNVFKNFLPFIVIEKENNLMIDRNNFDINTARLYNRRIVIRNNIRKDKNFFIRLYSFTEIKEILEKLGLSIIKTYSNWESKSFNINSQRMIIIASKN